MPTSDNDPIVRDDPISFLDWGTTSRPVRGNTTIVFVGTDGLPRRDKPSLGERLAGTLRCFEIDTALHAQSIRWYPPASEEAFRFDGLLQIEWRVHDPEAVCIRGIRDARSIFAPFLDQRLRQISRRFSIEECAAAEAEMNVDLKAAPFQLDQGIEIAACAVALRPDERAEEHLAGQVAVRRDGNRATAEHDLTVLRDRYATDEARLHHALEEMRAAAEHRLAKTKEQHAAELESLKQELAQRAAEHEIRLKHGQMDFYRMALEDQHLGVLLLHLMQHPNDVSEIGRMMRERSTYAFSLIDILNKHQGELSDLDPLRQSTFRLFQETVEELARATGTPAPHQQRGQD